MLCAKHVAHLRNSEMPVLTIGLGQIRLLVTYNIMKLICYCATIRMLNHRLNGSSSPVLTATSLSYGKAKNSTPPQNQNPWTDWDKIWQGWLRRRGDLSCKILCKSLQGGGFPANGWNIRKNFSSYIPFFQKLTYRSDPSADFCARWLKRRGLAQGCAFWGLKSLKLIFNVFIQKIQKKLQWGLWGKLNNYLNGHNFGCV